jgi:hypothetical protein
LRKTASSLETKGREGFLPTHTHDASLHLVWTAEAGVL